MPTNENEEFEFRLRDEKETAAKSASATGATAAPSALPAFGTPQSLERVKKDVAAFKTPQEIAKYAEDYKKQLQAQGVDLSIPNRELLHIQNHMNELADKSRGLGEQAADVAGYGVRRLGDAAAALAFVPGAGLAGKGLQAVGRSGGKVSDAGKALATISEEMAAQGPAAIATGGAVLGQAAEVASDYLEKAYGMSKNTADAIVAMATAGPQLATKAAKGVWDFLPSSKGTYARQTAREMHGPDADKANITEKDFARQLQDILDKLGMGRIKEGIDPLMERLKPIFAQEEKDIKRGAVFETRAAKQAAENYAKVHGEVVPAMVAQSRERNLGPDLTKSALGDEAKILTGGNATAMEQSRQAAGQKGWADLEAEAHAQEAAGNHINNTPAARKAVDYINNLIEKGTNKVSALDPKNKVAVKLKEIRDRLMGQEVGGGPAPQFRNFLTEMFQKGGIDSGLQQELAATTKDRPGLFKKGGMTYDDMLEYAVNHQWVSQGEVDKMNQSTPGGAHEWVKKVIQDELKGSRNYHPAEHQDAMDYQARQGQPQRVTRMEEYESIRRELKDLGDPANATKVGTDLAAKARDLERLVKQAMQEHAPKSANQRLFDYRDAVADESVFKTRLGKALTEQDPNAPGYQKTASHRVAEQIFAGRDPVATFKKMMGNDQAKFDQYGLSYLSSKLKDMTSAADAKKFLQSGYDDWKEELSAGARDKVAKYIKELESYEASGKSARSREKEKITEIAKLPALTESRVQASKEALLGGKEAVKRFQSMLLSADTGKRDELRGVYDAVSKQPGGKEAFHEAIQSVLLDEARKNGKTFYSTFENVIADKLLAAGTHTPQDIQELKGIAKALDDLHAQKVVTPEDYKRAIEKFANDESMKRSAWSALKIATVGATGGALFGAPHAGAGGLMGALSGGFAAGREAGGFLTRGGYNRFINQTKDEVVKIMADPVLKAAALAPPTPSNIQRLQGMLAKKLAPVGKLATQSAILQGEEKIGEKAKKAVGL